MIHIGIIGGGQLGRMLALAGYPLGMRFTFLDPNPDSPGAQLGGIVTGQFDDAAGLAELAGRVDLLTFDVENVPADVLRTAIGERRFLPPVDALATGQDRLQEKQLFQALDIPAPAYRTVDNRADLDNAVAALGLPCVLKTRRMGYDGRGQQVLQCAADIDTAWQRFGGVPLILEQFVAFDRELSLVGVRGAGNETRFYPLAENSHKDGILHITRAPYDDEGLVAQAQRHMRAILDRFDYAGILTIEFFLAGDILLANEIAPRVHNSGHWTIEGAATSQFENHMRAIAGLPLGSTAPVGFSAMVNFLGNMPDAAAVLRVPGAHLHDYGKTPRPQRKLGHATVIAATPDERESRLGALLLV